MSIHSILPRNLTVILPYPLPTLTRQMTLAHFFQTKAFKHKPSHFSSTTFTKLPASMPISSLSLATQRACSCS